MQSALTIPIPQLMKQAHFINFRYNFEHETRHEVAELRINYARGVRSVTYSTLDQALVKLNLDTRR